MRFTFILMLCLGFVSNVFADGKVSGKITDEKTGEALIGVTVLVPKLAGVGTMTDVDGQYDLKLPDGVYTIQVKYMGYQTKEIEDVKIVNGAVLTVNAGVQEEKTKELEGVVIRTTAKRETLNALYLTQKNAATVSDGISAEAIKKSPDKSTGEVLKRVSGTTIQDNKFVIIRGLSDRYNTALIDNAFLPSTEPNRKAFSFDIIPSALIDNIIISKSATPDLPGDFAGGVINILTKETPDQNFNSISIGSSYNTAATFKNFETGYKTPTDIVGFDNGSRQLPKNFPSASYFANNSITQDQSVQYLSMLKNDFSINKRSALPGMNLQGSLGRVYTLSNYRKFGLTAAVTYGHNETVKRDNERSYGNLIGKDQFYNYNTTLGALANFGYYYGKSKIVFKNLYNRIFDDNYLYREGYDNSSTTYIKYYAFDAIQKSLFKSSVEGEHGLGSDGQKKINWLVSYNFVGNNQPDQRKVLYASDNPLTTPYTANVTSVGRNNNRLFGDLKESIVNAGANYSTPYNLDFLYKSSLKVGVLGMYRHRDFSNRYVGAILDPSYGITESGSLRAASIENLFSSTYIKDKAYDFMDLTAPADAYTATSTTASAYVMSDNRITTRLRAVWGVRVESYNVNLKSQELVNRNLKVDNTWTDVLPSLNMSYALNDKSNLRMSYFRSVARPELRELAPMAYYDYELNMLMNGNTTLTRSQINNMDLRYEIFPKAGEVISGSVFFKQFDKTIENQLYAVGSSTEIKPVNYSNAISAGAEIEIRKSLDFIAKNQIFKNLTFYANLAYIYSRVKLEGDEQKYLDNASNYRSSRPMAGQSPYVINISLGYSAMESKLNFNLLYNRIGPRIYILGGEGQFADIYERPRNVMDFQASYSVSKRSEFRLNVKDIFNAKTVFYYDQNNNKKLDKVTYGTTSVDPYQDYIFQRYRQGTTFSLTYTYKF